MNPQNPIANRDIRQRGIEIVTQFEVAQNREVQLANQGAGYTLLSTLEGDERHILVKSSLGAIESRWLEQSQEYALRNDPLFVLYLVEHAFAENLVRVIQRQELLNQAPQVEAKYRYDFAI